MGDFGHPAENRPAMSDPSPTVSVVIPAYNRAATIRPAIESVLRQSWTDFELLVVDDGSTDGTLEAAAAVKDCRLRLLANPRNLGAAAARNTGIRAARGRWIAFQDSDDEWLPLKLEKQMGRLLAPGADHIAAYCGMVVLSPLERHGARAGRLRLKYLPPAAETRVEGDLLPMLAWRNLVSTQTLVARRELIERAGGFDESFTAIEDHEFILRLAQLGPIALVDEPLVLQRFSPNSLTRDMPRQVAMQEKLVEKHRALLQNFPRALARQHYVVAGRHRQLGNLPEARRALARAWAIRPLDPRIWAMAGYVAVLSCGRAAMR
jgi:glycosyltransferase involved in cell wall biosynthesis